KTLDPNPPPRQTSIWNQKSNPTQQITESQQQISTQLYIMTTQRENLKRMLKFITELIANLSDVTQSIIGGDSTFYTNLITKHFDQIISQSIQPLIDSYKLEGENESEISQLNDEDYMDHHHG
ncbi:hypothetical protein BpHYR1_053775, partial [Brachionus plicatilis]